MTRGRIWDLFQPNWSIFKFYPNIPFDLGFHGQYGVWKNCQACLFESSDLPLHFDIWISKYGFIEFLTLHGSFLKKKKSPTDEAKNKKQNKSKQTKKLHLGLPKEKNSTQPQISVAK